MNCDKVNIFKAIIKSNIDLAILCGQIKIRISLSAININLRKYIYLSNGTAEEMDLKDLIYITPKLCKHYSFKGGFMMKITKVKGIGYCLDLLLNYRQDNLMYSFSNN